MYDQSKVESIDLEGKVTCVVKRPASNLKADGSTYNAMDLKSVS